MLGTCITIAVSLFFCLGLTEQLNAAEVVLLGMSESAPEVMVTNSVLSDISLENGMAVSLSKTDSHISFTPFSSSWSSVENGTLLCDLSVVSDASNTVSVSFGDYNDPSLTVVSAQDWQILRAGTLPHIAETAECVTSTNHLEFVLRISESDQNGKLTARTSVNSSSFTDRPDLSFSSLNWHFESQLPENWQSITLQLAGSSARILRFRIKYRPDGSMVIFR